MDIQKRIRDLMEIKGWTMYRLAKEAKLSNSTVNHMFEKETPPTIPILLKICDAFGITLGQFFAEKGDPIVLTPEQEKLLVRWGTMSDKQAEIVKDAMEQFK